MGRQGAEKTGADAAAWRWLAMAVLGAGALAAGPAGLAQETRIAIRVVNADFSAVEVRIVDDICRRTVFEGQIMGEAEILVMGCRDADGEATLTIADREGHVRTYAGLPDAAMVQLGDEDG